MSLDPARLAHEMWKCGVDWADKKAAAEALEETTKSVLGQCRLKTQGTVAERDDQARNDPTYLGHLDALHDARRALHKARVAYDVVQVRIELVRTAESTRRAEMRLT